MSYRSEDGLCGRGNNMRVGYVAGVDVAAAPPPQQPLLEEAHGLMTIAEAEFGDIESILVRALGHFAEPPCAEAGLRPDPDGVGHALLLRLRRLNARLSALSLHAARLA